MRRALLIRQRPSIGDCLLLSPLVREYKRRNPDAHLTVLTDVTYLCGALPQVFRHTPGVDEVVCVSSTQWTTKGNQVIEPRLLSANTTFPPPGVKGAFEDVFDCNSAFMQYERERGLTPDLGITEFWLKRHGLYREGMSMCPEYTVNPEESAQVDVWLEGNKKPILGIVLQAGDPVRNWDRGTKKAAQVADWAHTKGYLPVTIDAARRSESRYAKACIGKPLPFVAALVQKCAKILTPDTGILHLAEAVHTPTVSMWTTVAPHLRCKDYDTKILPRTPKPPCNNPTCRTCQWRAQHYSCPEALTLRNILDALKA